jgi:uncharacterized protein (TIGR03437 family)
VTPPAEIRREKDEAFLVDSTQILFEGDTTQVKLAAIPVILFFLTCGAPLASAQVSYGPSNQVFTYTGIGPNAAGNAQYLITLGACVFDGTNTVCTLSGPFTGFEGGGTFSWVLSYPGNGPSTFTAAVGSSGGISASVTKGTIVLNLTGASGTVVPITSYGYSFSLDGTPTCAPSTVTCDLEHVGLTPGATISAPVSGSFNITPSIFSQGVVTAQAFGGSSAIAPGSWIEIYGSNLAFVASQTWAGSDFKGSTAPTTLGGTTVTIGGQLAFIDYVSPGQVNVQVPSGVATGAQPIVVTNAAGSSSAYGATVTPTAPALLAPSSFVFFGNQYVVALFSGTSTYALPFVNVTGIATANPTPGDNITLYGVGFGPVTPNTPAGQIASGNSALSSFQIFFGGIPAVVTYAGLDPGTVGLYQFNVVVPNLPYSPTVPLTFTLNGVPGTQTLLTGVN